MDSAPDSESVSQDEALFSARPWPFLGRPAWTLVSLLLIVLAFTGLPGLELGLFFIAIALVMLITLWFDSVSQTLHITEDRTVLEKELFASATREIAHSEVRYVHVKRDVLQRILGTGTLQLSSVGPGHIEISCPGIRNPQTAKTLIESYASSSDPGPT